MPHKPRPSILVAYPSCFHYPGHFGREQIKSSQLLLASYLSNYFPVEYIDFEILIGRPQSDIQIKRFERQVRACLAQQKYDILALSCWTSLCYRATMMISRISRELYPDRLIVVGGYHPTARPEDFITENAVIDYVVRGEGEITMKEIAESFSTAGRPPHTQVIVGHSLTPDDFAPMNWDLVDDLIGTHFPDGLNTLVIFLSRGCPFNCSFCMETLKNHRWRSVSPESAIEQVREAGERYRFTALGFGDACFGVKSRWRKEFLRRLADYKPSFWVLFETRPEYLDPEDIELLGQFKAQVQIGIESCSPRMLHIMNKSRQPEKFLAAFRDMSHRLSDHGVVHGANLVFNHPGETRKTIEETFAFMDAELSRGPSYLMWTSHSYTHFPGSEIDRNRSYYEQTYGTIFQCPEWWKENDDQYKNGRRVIPSHDLTGDRTNLWHKMLTARDPQLRNALAPRAFTIAANAIFPEWKNDPRYKDMDSW